MTRDKRRSSENTQGRTLELEAEQIAAEGSVALRAIRRSISASIGWQMASPGDDGDIDPWAPTWVERNQEKLDDLMLRLGTARLEVHDALAQVLNERIPTYFADAHAILILAGELNQLTFETAKLDRHTQDPVLHCTLELHSQALVVADEALTLLRSGFVEGTRARWRTLFEILVTATAIQRGGPPVAARYLESAKVEARRLALLGDLREPGIGPLTATRFAAISAIVEDGDTVINEHGREMQSEHGWARPLFDGGDVTFARIVALTGFQEEYRRYRIASHAIHGTRQASFRVLAGGPEHGLAFQGAHQNMLPTLMDVLDTVRALNSVLYEPFDSGLTGMYLHYLLDHAVMSVFADLGTVPFEVPASWASKLILTRDSSKRPRR